MGRSPNERIDRAARRLTRKRLKALRKELEKLGETISKGGDTVEPVHHARIASRRLRSALDVVEPLLPPKKFRRWLRAIRRLTHGLGETRDLDVQLEFVGKQIAACNDKRKLPGLDRLRLRLAQQRTRSEKRAAKVMAKPKLNDAMIALGEWLEGSADSPAPVGASITSIDVIAEPTGTMAERITHRLRERIEDLLAFDATVYVPSEVEKLHEMRIATKRLRYTLELVKRLAHGRFDEAIDKAALLQELLGDLHDCDVWIAFLPQFLDEETQRTAEYFGHTTPMSRVRPGIDALLQNRRHARQRVYRRLLEFWRQTMRDNVWSYALAASAV